MTDWREGFRRAVLAYAKAGEDVDVNSVEIEFSPSEDFGGDTGVQYEDMRIYWTDAQGERRMHMIWRDDIADFFKTLTQPTSMHEGTGDG